MGDYRNILIRGDYIEGEERCAGGSGRGKQMFTLQTIAGDRFWIGERKGAYTHRQLLDHVGAIRLEPHIDGYGRKGVTPASERNPVIPGTVKEIRYQQTEAQS